MKAFTTNALKEPNNEAFDDSNAPSDLAYIGAEYQPLVATKSGDQLGYEALARFWSPSMQTVPPSRVFSLVHSNPQLLLKLEEAAKRVQISHAPSNGYLFLNLDPHTFHFGSQLQASLLQHLQSRPKVVIELIENSNHSEGMLSERLASYLTGLKLDLAVDDLGAAGSLVSFPVLIAAHYLKLDRSWVHCNDPAKITLLETLIDYAQRSGKQTILEGIESDEDLKFAQSLGVNWVQGFLFKSDFIATEPLALSLLQ